MSALAAAPELSPFAETIYRQKYAWPGEEWPDTARRVVGHVVGALGYGPGDDEHDRLVQLIAERKFIPGGRYLYAAGRDLHQVQNCLLLKAEDSREGWAELYHNAAMALQTGAGIGVDYSAIRPHGAPIRRTGGIASGPIPLATAVNELGRAAVQGGDRRAAMWGGLNWRHQDALEWTAAKDWHPTVRELKKEDFNFPAPLEFTNLSILLDDEFFNAYHDPGHEDHGQAHAIYWATVRRMLKTAEPGFSVDVGDNRGETLRNACTEITSSDDSDICNLGSINLARIENIEEMREAVELCTLFLLAGTVYSDVPYPKVAETRSLNRRLGLGIMGVHEWQLKRGLKYAPSAVLASWLNEYARSTEVAARWADQHGLSRPVKTRAIAPTGTIGIVAETTTGIEPIFCVAYKRRYYAGAAGNGTWKYQYVVDPTAKRLVESGVDPDSIEDAYVLSYDIERRVDFQAWVQRWVDHGISSTINLPGQTEDEGEVEEFGDMLLEYLPFLRGVTVYPDGARGGQPLVASTFTEAFGKEGVVFEEDASRACASGSCGA